MRLRLVSNAASEPVVAISQAGRWVPLTAIAGLPEDIDPGDLVGVLGADETVWDGIRAGMDNAVEQVVTVEPRLPFTPIGIRAYPVWAAEIEHVTATALHRFSGPLQRHALDLLGRRTTDTVASVLGPHWERFPRGFRASTLSVLGEADLAPWPSFTQALDLELGLGAIVAQRVEPGGIVHARDVIGGYVTVATVVARDVEHGELRTGRFGPSVSRDIATFIGSEVVTRHLLPHGRLGGLETSMTIGEELWSEGTTAGAQHSLDEVLTRAAQAGGLQAGELMVVTCPPGGTGAGRDRWVSPGDLVTFDVQHLGSLTVQIGQPAPYLHDGRLERARWTVVERMGHGPEVPSVAPVGWTPPPVPALEGPLAPNTALDAAELLPTAGASKPEDVALGPDGAAYAGVEDGRIFRWGPDGGPGTVVADTHGRPLGIEVTAQGDLVVCDADRGLLRIGVDGQEVGLPETLVSSHAGLALKFTNNAAIGADGTIYFTDSSTRFGIADYRMDLLEHGANGRLFAWRPGRRAGLELLADGLHFPNGVALTPDEDALLYVETATYSLSRLWLSGSRAGEQELLTDQLPGFGDNMSSVGDGTYWVAIPNRRNSQLDMVLPRPAARRVVTHIPERFQPQPERYSLVVLVDEAGQVLRSLHGPGGVYAMITGVRQHEDWLYLSSLVEPGIARVPLTEAAGLAG